MKKILFVTLMALTSLTTFAAKDTGMVWVRSSSQAELDSDIRSSVLALRRGTFRGSLQDKCSSADERKVYAVEVKGLNYRTDRNGNLIARYTAVLKYSCNYSRNRD